MKKKYLKFLTPKTTTLYLLIWPNYFLDYYLVILISHGLILTIASLRDIYSLCLTVPILHTVYCVKNEKIKANIHSK